MDICKDSRNGQVKSKMFLNQYFIHFGMIIRAFVVQFQGKFRYGIHDLHMYVIEAVFCFKQFRNPLETFFGILTGNSC